MKRAAIQLADIAERGNLATALYKAARGKSSKPAVRSFVADSDHQLCSLQRSIVNGSAPLGDYREFSIVDPKPRIIRAACFPDRVLHHAIMNVAGPVLERSLIADTYACLPGRGVHAAARRVQSLLRLHPWYVKVDIAGYFAAIDHRRLIKLLAATFKGAEFLALLSRVIAANGAQPGAGLPIGSLTSQYFANHYLNEADRLICQHWRYPLVRYMDDIIWWCPDRATAKASLEEFREWLLCNRGLQLHANTQINRSRCGVSYCGFRITTAGLRLSRRRKRRYVKGRRDIEQLWLNGVIDSGQLQRGYAAIKAITLPADSAGFRHDNLRRHPPVQA